MHEKYDYIGVHNHTDFSNIRLIDAISKTDLLIDRAVELGHKGVAITDHEILSGHIIAMQHVQKGKKKGTIPPDFKLILGNEIYVIDNVEDAYDNYESGVTKFYHMVLLAKDEVGHEQLRVLSSQAWEDSFHRGILRVPTTKGMLEKVIGENQGHIISSSACLGSEFAQMVLKWIEEEKIENNEKAIQKIKVKIHEYLHWGIGVFGKENFFIELQPARYEEQIEYNKKALVIAKAYEIDWIVANDSHYLKEEDREVHKAFLNSKEGEREVDAFYKYAYMMGTDEIIGHMQDYMDIEDLEIAFKNTCKIGNMIEEYDLTHSVIVPKIGLPEFELNHMFKEWYDKYEFIKNFAYSEDEQDRYYLYLVEEGLKEKENLENMKEEKFFEIANRIDEEMKELWLITEEINTGLSSYYITVRKVIEIIWDKGDSLVGVSRGSSGGWYTAYLMDIVQLNPMDYDLPHFRHLHHSRGDLPDIDLDSEQSRRVQILSALKEYFGENRVLNIATFGTEGSRSSVLTACRSLDINDDDAQAIAGMIPSSRGSNWSLDDCFYGNEEEDRKPATEFINAVERYPRLRETIEGISGVINKRSVHASGIYIFQNHYTTQNAMMRSPNGQPTTQYASSCSDALGGLKIDALTVQGLDKIRVCLDLLIEDGLIEDQGSLKTTYDKYIHPDVLDYDTVKMWELLENNDIASLFQFDTSEGSTTVQKTKPRNIVEMAQSNSLMRLQSDGKEQPIDVYLKHREDISTWYDEMNMWKLTENEVKLMEKYLLPFFGVATTQEDIMLISMDSEISNFSVAEANQLRKGVARKQQDVIDSIKELFYSKGLKSGAREQFLKYVWEVQISRQLGYSFSVLHSTGYSLIGLQDMNLAYHYPRVYWNTSVLTNDAGANEDNSTNRGTNYGRIATAIGNMQSQGTHIALPNINKAKFGFTPDAVNNIIVFALKGTTSIGDHVANEIIKGRPYESFQDFLDRMVFINDSVIKQNNVIQLIKAGCFDELEDRPRTDVMRQYMEIVSEPRNRLTMQNFQGLINHNLIPDKYALEVRFYNFRKHIYSAKPYRVIKNTNPKLKKKIDDEIYLLDDFSTSFYLEHFNEDDIVEYAGANILVSKKEFEKEYKAKMKKVTEYIRREEVLEEYNTSLFNEAWEKHANGSISAWEMESVSFYYSEHELANINKEKYGVVNFFDLPKEPVIAGWNTYRGRQRPKFEITRIAGTVLDRDKYKHTISLLTPEGVVTVKQYAGAFGHYDRRISQDNPDGTKTVLENSWYRKNTKLILSGYRRGDNFHPRTYADSVYQHTVSLITEVKDNGDLVLQTERVGSDR